MKVSYTRKNKRLRKKLYLGEFAVYGFEFYCKLNSNVEEDLDKFFDDIMNLVESRELMAGGGGNADDFSMFVCSVHRYGSTTEEDRDVIEKWLSDNNLVLDINVGGLVDANEDV